MPRVHTHGGRHQHTATVLGIHHKARFHHTDRKQETIRYHRKDDAYGEPMSNVSLPMFTNLDQVRDARTGFDSARAPSGGVPLASHVRV